MASIKRCCRRYSPAVRTLRERLQWILTSQEISSRELARRAGLAAPQVSLLLRRLEQNDQEGVTLRTLTALANGAGVSLAWLTTGEGAPGASAEPVPARAAAAVLARDDGVWPEAIRSVLADELGPGEAERSPEWWLLRIKTREIEMIDEAVRRREVVARQLHARMRNDSPLPSTMPARSGGRRKRGAGEESEAAPEAPPEAKPKR
jgi:transcriptional regulator with XRE-family HTH domain